MTPWPVVPLGEVAETALGKMLDKGKSRGLPRVPYLRNVNVQWGRIDTHDLLEMELADDERERFGVRPGDLLTCEGGEIGRCAIWQGRAEYLAFQKALHRVRPTDRLDATYLRYLMQHHADTGVLAALATGSTIAHLPQQQLRRVPVPLPAVDVQRRIVDLLEDHLSRLDAGARDIATAAAKLASLRERLVMDAITGAWVAGPRTPSSLEPVGTLDGTLSDLPEGWRWARLGDVAAVAGGVTKDAKKQSDPALPEVPYLRVANVQRARLDLRQVTSIRVPAAKAEALRLEVGDVLMNEGGDRDKLARGWVWEGQVDGCIHQNHVFRARVTDPDLDPYFLSWTTNTFGGRWAERNGRQSVNLASISLKTIRLMPVVVPPPGVAARVVNVLRDRLHSVERLQSELDATAAQGQALRRALLTAAFSGRLTGAASDADRARR